MPGKSKEGRLEGVLGPADCRLMEQVYFQCQRCAKCCRWPGFVRVTNVEITAIARYLGIDEDAFIQQYTRLRPRRDGLALIDKPNGECFFLDGNVCTLQPVKPGQCRDFPNRWNFPGWRDVCEAIPVTPWAERKSSHGATAEHGGSTD